MRASFAFFPVKQIGAQKSPAIHKRLMHTALPQPKQSHSFCRSDFCILF
jgi:hypothetical protein